MVIKALSELAVLETTTSVTALMLLNSHFTGRTKDTKLVLLVIIFQSLEILIPASSSDSGMQSLCCFGAGSFLLRFK